ncbi:MAG TPA: 3-hydroxyacyl-CoA dehydrogenase family protein, partial [Candidatus Limnocylindrales bacterium]|nr:3-hydroxyacyl-CoA dehydrogenase family protein [Candidatus Limnocylindrales bacterium]
GRLTGLRESATLDGVAGEADVVIEAALEDLELKRTIFRALDSSAAADVILATNTSALPVAAIAAATTRPGRVIGLHFFNPAPVMPLVEVVVPAGASMLVVDRATALVTAWGKTPVRCADAPGFIVNRVNRPFTLEALAMLEAGAAGVSTIDAVIRDAGYPMGPFELMDLIGIDVNLAAAHGVWAGLGRPDRLRPSAIQERLIAEGRLGRKTGRGFYRYEGAGRPPTPDPEFDVVGTLAMAAIADRITLAVVNEAWYALGDGVATAPDIDVALRLGAAHPIGPFERTEALGGPAAVTAALEGLSRHGQRFAPAPALAAGVRES